METRVNYQWALPVIAPPLGPAGDAQYQRVICTPLGAYWTSMLTDQGNPVAEDAFTADGRIPSAAPGGTMGYNVAANLRALNAAGNLDRARFLATDADAQVAAQLGLLGTVARGQLFNGATWDRGRSLATDTDAQVAAQLGLAGVVARPQIFNGTTFDRERAPVSFATVTATAAGNTGIVAGVGGQRIRLLRYIVSITSNVAAAAAGIETIDFLIGGASVGVGHGFFVPAAAVVTGFGAHTTGWVDLGPLGFLGGLGNALNLNLGLTLTSGQVTATVAFIQSAAA